MTRRSSLIFIIILIVAILCACTKPAIENNKENTQQVDMENEQGNEKEKEELLFEPPSEEEQKQQKKQRLEELTKQFEIVHNKSNELMDLSVNQFAKDNDEEKDEVQIKAESDKSRNCIFLEVDILRQIYSLLDMKYDEKYIFDFENSNDIQIDGNRALNAAEFAIYYPDMNVPWQIGDYHFVQALIGGIGIGAVTQNDEPRSTIIKRDMTIGPYDTVQILYTNGEKSISLNIVNVKYISELGLYLDEINTDIFNNDAVYTDYMTEPYKPDYEEYDLLKYGGNVDKNCFNGFGMFNTDKTYYMAVEVGPYCIHHSLKRLITIPNNENTYDNLVKLIDELNLSTKADALIGELGLK